MTTRWEVEEALKTVDMEPTGRHIMLRLLTKSTVGTAEVPVQHAPTFDELAAWTGYSRSAVAEWMKALSASGWVRRATTVANVKSGYELSVGATVVALPKRESRKTRSKSRSPLSGPDVDAASRDEVPASAVIEGEVVRSADQSTSAGSPLSGPEVVRQADQSSPLSGLPVEPSPISSSLTFTNPDRETVTPLIPKPRPAVGVVAWSVANTPSPRRSVTNPPHIHRQKPLFAQTDVKISDREQVILDWLRDNDYPEATHADAKAVDKMVSRAHPGKRVGYLRGIATGSGFASFYLKVREERAKKVDEQIKHLERTRPSCAHGTLAGNELHPTHGTMLCPQCRAGIPAKPDQPTTPAPVAAALDAFNREHSGYLSTFELIGVTQQITALHAAGATEQQLVTVAVTAAKTGVGILAAAARKDS